MRMHFQKYGITNTFDMADADVIFQLVLVQYQIFNVTKKLVIEKAF